MGKDFHQTPYAELDISFFAITFIILQKISIIRIKSVRIQNFRCFKDEIIKLDNYSCFVGANGAGKSTILNALNVFFRQTKDVRTDLIKLSVDDFHHKNVSEPIRITVTFVDINDSAKSELSDYIRHEQLVITAEAQFNQETGKAETKQYGQLMAMPAFKPYFELLATGKVTDLTTLYNGLKELYPELPKKGTKDIMTANLREYEEARPELCELIPSEDSFYGFTRINKLSPYVQRVFLSASKDAVEEGEESKNSALGQLLARTVRAKVDFNERINNIRKEASESYNALLVSEQDKLDKISSSLQSRLSSWSHPNIRASVLWKQDPDKTIKVEEPSAFIQIGERGFESDLSRFGHGIQRSCMLALLQELASLEVENIPTLIMAIEEPELYQHPPQARFLAETLMDLTDQDNQILICTHSPLFIPGDNFDKVRIVREIGLPSYTSVSYLTYSDLSDFLHSCGDKLLKETGVLAKLYPSLNPMASEMFFCRNLILVEGIEDIAYIMTYLILTEEIENFRKHGFHIVNVDGKSNLLKPIAMATLLNIPCYVMFDADTDTNPAKEDWIKLHKKENGQILKSLNYEDSDWPTEHLVKSNLTMWKTNLTKELELEFGDSYKPHLDKACAHYGHAKSLNKNPLVIAKALELAWIAGVKSVLLQNLVNSIINFAKIQFPNNTHIETSAVDDNTAAYGYVSH